MYLLFAFAYVYIARHIPPLIPFSAINNRSTSVYGTNFIPVVFKQACYVNPGRDKKMSRFLTHKFSSTSSSNNVSFWTYKSL